MVLFGYSVEKCDLIHREGEDSFFIEFKGKRGGPPIIYFFILFFVNLFYMPN